MIQRRYRLLDFADGKLPDSWVWAEATNHDDGEPHFVPIRKKIAYRHTITNQVIFIDPVLDGIPRDYVRDE